MWKKLFAALLCAALLCPGALALEGIDVSTYQGEIDFSAIKATGIEAVYIRSSFGSEGVDDRFEENRRGFAQVGLPYGFYHFLEAQTPEEARAEARRFAALIRGTGYTCRPVLDFEVDRNLSDEQISAIVTAFLAELADLTGVTPMLYADVSTAVRLSPSLNVYPLWIAQWEVEAPQLSDTPWESWTGWQYSSRGRVDGIRDNVDLDRFTDGILLREEETGFDYTIRRSDTLWAIARRFGTTVTELARLNGIADPNRIYAGEALRVPNLGSLTYQVRRGDTLWAIARRYGVTVGQLVRWNDIQNPDLIYLGQIFRVR